MSWMKFMLLFTISPLFYLLSRLSSLALGYLHSPGNLRQSAPYIKAICVKITRLLARDSEERIEMVGDGRTTEGRGWRGTVGDGEGLPGTA